MDVGQFRCRAYRDVGLRDLKDSQLFGLRPKRSWVYVTFRA